MKSNNEISQKLKVLSTPGIGRVLVDVLQLYREEIMDEHALPVGVYAQTVEEVIKALRKSYKTQEKSDKVASVQGDLETLINNLLSGEEKPWRNNQINSNGQREE